MAHPFITEVPVASHAQRNPYGIIGGTFESEVTSIDQVLDIAGLNWEVETHEFSSTIVDLDETGVRTQVVGPKNKRLVVRKDPNGDRTALEATVGKGYPPIQHRQVAEIGQALVDSSDVRWTAGGQYADGLRHFFQLQFPEEILIGGADPVGLSLVLFGGHDGESAVVGVPTATRLFCCNQFPALRKSKTRFSIAHRGDVTIKIGELRKAIGLTFKAADEIKHVGDRLFSAKITSKEFLDFVDVIYPLGRDKDGEVTAQSRNRQSAVRAIYETEADQVNVHGTRWGALQAVIAYEDWHATTRGHGEAAHARRIVAHTADNIKTEASRLLLSGV